MSASTDTHAEPSGECVFCCEELTEENYAEYQAKPDGPWFPSLYCQFCIESAFIANAWDKYMEQLEKADCAAALRRVLSVPPPLRVKDAGFKECKDNGLNDEVWQFWYAADKEVHSAKVKGALEGAERDAFWAEKQAFLTATELAEEKAKLEKEKEKDKPAASSCLSTGEKRSAESVEESNNHNHNNHNHKEEPSAGQPDEKQADNKEEEQKQDKAPTTNDEHTAKKQKVTSE